MPRTRKEEDLARIYLYIREYFAEHGIAPSHREIAEHTYIGRSSIARFLDVLAERGLIIRGDGIARGIGLPKCEECTCDGLGLIRPEQIPTHSAGE